MRPKADGEGPLRRVSWRAQAIGGQIRTICSGRLAGVVNHHRFAGAEPLELVGTDQKLALTGA